MNNTGPAEPISVFTLDNVMYIDSGLKYMIQAQSIPFSNKKPCEKPVRYKPWTPEWLDQMIRKLDNPQAVGYLRAWMPS